jgi:hypothetical protein
MGSPIYLLLLRAYGDFVIALHLAAKNQLSIPIRLIASAHFEPLYKALPIELPANLSIQFVPFNIQHNIMGCFTNRYLINPSVLKELQAVKQFIKANPIEGQYFLEQQKRSSLIGIFCNHSFKSIIQDQNIYQGYADFFAASLDSLANNSMPTDLENKRVLIIPDARLAKRKITPDLLELINNDWEMKGATTTIAYFGKPSNDASNHLNTVHYQNFNELVNLIQSKDIIIGSDSMPIHLAQLLGKPHYILYPHWVKHQFFTPFALKQQSYFTFEEMAARQSFFPNGK